MKGLSVPARLYVTAVIVAALVAVVAAIAHYRDFSLSAALVLGLMYIVLESRTTVVTPTAVVLGMGSSFALASYMIVGPWGATLVGACTVFSIDSTSVVKRLFNSAQFALCAFLAGQVYVALDGPVGQLHASDFPRVLWPVLMADLTHCVANAVLIAAVVSLTAKVPVGQVLTGTMLKSVVSYLGYAVYGLLMAALWSVVGFGRCRAAAGAAPAVRRPLGGLAVRRAAGRRTRPRCARCARRWRPRTSTPAATATGSRALRS